MAQRALIPIVAAARSALSGIVDHSWEGVAYGDPSLRTFSSKNLTAGALKVYSYASPDAPSPGIAEYIVSKGSLDGFTPELDSYPIDYSRSAAMGEDPKIFPAMPDKTKGSTVLYHLMNFFKTKNIDALKAGQQLSFLILRVPSVKVLNYVGGTSGTYNVPVTKFEIARFILPDVSGISDIANYHDVNDEFYLDGAVAEAGTNTVTLKRADGFKITIFSDAQSFGFSPSFMPSDDSRDDVGSALIVSELVNNSWRRSSSILQIGDPEHNVLVKNVFGFDQWCMLYAPKTIVSSKYLNRGPKETGVNS